MSDCDEKGAFSDLEVNGTSVPAATLGALATIAGDVTGIIDVAQGYQEYDECADWESDVGDLQRETEGKVAVWFSSASMSNGLEPSVYRYNAELVVRVPKKYSSWMGQAIDLAYSLSNAWQTSANYSGANCEMPARRIEFRLVRIRHIDTAGICYFSFGSEAGGGIEVVGP